MILCNYVKSLEGVFTTTRPAIVAADIGLAYDAWSNVNKQPIAGMMVGTFAVGITAFKTPFYFGIEFLRMGNYRDSKNWYY